MLKPVPTSGHQTANEPPSFFDNPSAIARSHPRLSGRLAEFFPRGTTMRRRRAGCDRRDLVRTPMYVATLNREHAPGQFSLIMDSGQFLLFVLVDWIAHDGFKIVCTVHISRDVWHERKPFPCIRERGVNARILMAVTVPLSFQHKASNHPESILSGLD